LLSGRRKPSQVEALRSRATSTYARKKAISAASPAGVIDLLVALLESDELARSREIVRL
jgi:hypothetical protein